MAGIWATLILLLGATAASAAATQAHGEQGDVGYRGPSFTGAGAAPTGSKPESKLWWNDGLWWASMWSDSSQSFNIFRLNPTTQAWLDTGVRLDERSGTRADVLWDGVHLYVASHVFSESPASGHPSLLYRYAYSPATRSYVRDAGFPVAINNWSTETLVIDKDSTGKLWATWVQRGRVYLNRTIGSDRTWGVPFVLPVGTAVTNDDISSLIAFGGDRIGVMWSDQRTWEMHFAVHLDRDPDDEWLGPEVAFRPANDHINLKADAAGRVYAAVKTPISSDPEAPGIALLVRDPRTKRWDPHQVATDAEGHTRPIIMLDEERRLLHIFTTVPARRGANSGHIHRKTSRVDAISFAPGLGERFISSSQRPSLNNATSTKQNVTLRSGLVVLASHNGLEGRYWHNAIAIPSPPPPPPAPPKREDPCTIRGSTGNDILRGTPGDDVICAGAGADRIYGRGGNDVIYAGPGNDVVYGGPGTDRIYGRGGNDVVYGGPGNDIVYGGRGPDRIYGQRGNDAVYGGRGADRISGGLGRDTLYGGRGRDLLLARDLTRDVVNGGPGRDRARIDPRLDVVRRVEMRI